MGEICPDAPDSLIPGITWSFFMQQFTIRQIEQLSGIKAPTLRIWEKRYNLISPDRSEGRQRIYTNEDLRAILKVVYLYEKGMRISKIARMKEQQMLQHISDLGVSSESYPGVILMLIEAAISLESNRVLEIFNSIEKEHGFENLVLRIIYPFLEKLGRAWVSGKILPNNEHFVSHLITRKILLATDQLPEVVESERVVILFQPQGEIHEIPLLFMQYLFKKHGWKTVYFGCNVPINVVEGYLAYKKATHIYSHLITNLGEDSPNDFFRKLSEKFPGMYIAVGGHLVQKMKAAGTGVLLLQNDEDVYNYLRTWPVMS
jgi:DNA-binding transcriptional MerR regulator